MDTEDALKYKNMSSGNMSQVVFPKGYSLHHLIPVAVIMSIIILLIVLGNLLVIVAVATDKNLKMVQNWFIASLAVADCLLGLIIMPFSLANELMGYWIFGSVWCDLWKSIDVLLCTASIMTICLISLDRYWSITRAIEYSQKRTPKRALIMIGAVWALSMIICLPPLIGWKNPLPVSDYPICDISSEMGYIIYSSMGSFFIPAVIMVVVYYQIYREAKSRARRSQLQNKKKMINKEKECKFFACFNKKNYEKELECCYNENNGHDGRPRTLSEDESMWPVYGDVPDNKTIPSKESECSSNEKSMEAIALLNEQIAPLESNVCFPKSDASGNRVSEFNGEQNKIHQGPNTMLKEFINETNKTRENLTASARPDVETMGVSNRDHEDMIVVANRVPVNARKSNWSKRESNGNDTIKELEKQKRKLAKARERRATIVLGIVMAAFIVCWFPFFFLYNINAFCNCIHDLAFKIFFWAGYCNSALNPIIYTVFNQDFRNAFHKIVFKFELCKS